MFKHATGSERSQQKADKPKFESERFRRKRTANPTVGAYVRRSHHHNKQPKKEITFIISSLI
jgi:hypothetical protein